MIRRKRTKTCFSVCIIVVIAAGLLSVACRASKFSESYTETPVSWRSFESPSIGGFSIEYPARWSAHRFANGFHNDQHIVALFDTPYPFPVVTVARKEMKSPMLEDVASWGEDRILSLNNRPYDEYELFNQEYVIINGLQVITREYLMDEETPLPLHKKDVYIARTHDGIILTLSATASNFEEALIIFDHMVASFESIEE